VNADGKGKKKRKKGLSGSKFNFIGKQKAKKKSLGKNVLKATFLTFLNSSVFLWELEHFKVSFCARKKFKFCRNKSVEINEQKTDEKNLIET
jgi:hypothetical protein